MRSAATPYQRDVNLEARWHDSYIDSSITARLRRRDVVVQFRVSQAMLSGVAHRSKPYVARSLHWHATRVMVV